MLMDLTQLGNGRMAAIESFSCDLSCIKEKLEAMGILHGTVIIKKSASFMKGPVVIEKDKMKIALGYCTAQKIIVRPVDNEKDSSGR